MTWPCTSVGCHQCCSQVEHLENCHSAWMFINQIQCHRAGLLLRRQTFQSRTERRVHVNQVTFRIAPTLCPSRVSHLLQTGRHSVELLKVPPFIKSELRFQAACQHSSLHLQQGESVSSQQASDKTCWMFGHCCWPKSTGRQLEVVTHSQLWLQNGYTHKDNVRTDHLNITGGDQWCRSASQYRSV